MTRLVQLWTPGGLVDVPVPDSMANFPDAVVFERELYFADLDAYGAPLVRGHTVQYRQRTPIPDDLLKAAADAPYVSAHRH